MKVGEASIFAIGILEQKISQGFGSLERESRCQTAELSESLGQQGNP